MKIVLYDLPERRATNLLFELTFPDSDRIVASLTRDRKNSFLPSATRLRGRRSSSTTRRSTTSEHASEESTGGPLT